MFDVTLARLRQGFRTIDYLGGKFALPLGFRGQPLVNPGRCLPGCTHCSEACPVDAISRERGEMLHFDLGKCLFCPVCAETCPQGAITHGKDHRLAARERQHLLTSDRPLAPIAPLAPELRKTFGRSLKLRQVSGGGCNACEADLNVLSTVVFDLGSYGVQFVASPRHADGLVLTGPLTENMRLAFEKTFEAIPSPKLLIAVGSCAISGGVFAHNSGAGCGLDSGVKADLYVPGCPPHPTTLLDAILRLLGRV